MAQSTVGKAIGAVKDQTSIGIAKVGRNISSDIEILIVKSTSHDNQPSHEKYLSEILNLASHDRKYMNVCLLTISKRLSKTHNWIVALKSLMVVNRLMMDGGDEFCEEILYATRGGTRLLNMAGFRNDANSNKWDQFGFVRAYSMYLDRKIELMVFENRSGGVGFNPTMAMSKDMKPLRVLEKMVQLQRLLGLFLACRPIGEANSSHLVLFAIYSILEDSTKVYRDICIGLKVLLDRFLEMELKDCVNIYEIHVGTCKLIEELLEFYNWYKGSNLTRSFKFVDVRQISFAHMQILEGLLKEKANKQMGVEIVKDEKKVGENDVKPKIVNPPQEVEDLVDLRDDYDDFTHKLADWEVDLLESVSNNMSNREIVLCDGVDSLLLDELYAMPGNLESAGGLAALPSNDPFEASLTAPPLYLQADYHARETYRWH